VSAPPPPGDDPRLRRYSQYKSEKELYAEYASRASGSTGPSQPQRATNVRTVPASTYAPAVSSTPSVERTPNLPPIPAATSGAETKEVYGNVINFITTRCPHANLQIFKDNCRRFGQDQMTLDAFFSYLTSICTRPLMIELVPQLVRLLPTKEKREHLWEVYTREILLIK
jgi:hypothetical protein